MVSNILSESEEPRRFCVASAMHAYNAMHDFLLGSEKTYSGKLAELQTQLARKGYGEYALDALHDQDEISDRLQDLRIELSSVMQSIEIVSRRGYDLEPREVTLESRLVEQPYSLGLTPTRHATMISKIHTLTRAAREDVVKILESRASYLEQRACDDAGRYDGFILAISAQHLATAQRASKKFEKLIQVIRPPKNTP